MIQHPVARLVLFSVVLAAGAGAGPGVGGAWGAELGNLAEYFRAETDKVEARAFAGVETRADWEAKRPELRRELLEMLGLWPMPERTALKPVVTGTLEHDGVVVERLHFQSMPGLYVTANLYRPKRVEGKLPAVLYVCGHAQVKTNGLSCGNKTGYQHHGYWFARHGYVALLIDTLQLGEIEGAHHGTYRMGQWWWNSRGYSPAGVEAWNGVRALDYLETRPEVDADRIGMTGRSGGGSYTWTTAAIDERVRVAAPVAGITDLRNQVVDGVVEGHCDCMFFVNRHRWDFGLNAALLAPRPLLIVNTDSDSIFPLDGVQRVHAQVRRIYDLLGASNRLGLVIGPGTHQDTQDLQVPVFRWFSRHLKGVEAVIAEPAVKVFDPLALRVFGELPADERNTTAAEWFPRGRWMEQVSWEGDEWKSVVDRLRAEVFGGWPGSGETAVAVRAASSETREGWVRRSWTLETQAGIRVPMVAVARDGEPPRRVVVQVLTEPEARDREAGGGKRETGAWTTEHERSGGAGGLVMVSLVPRGLGLSGSGADAEAKRGIQIRRRFMLLGQTLDGMRVFDIVEAVRFLRRTYGGEVRIEMQGNGEAAVNALLAGMLEREISSVRLRELPDSLRAGPDYLNLLKFGDIAWLRRLAEARGLGVAVDSVPGTGPVR